MKIAMPLIDNKLSSHFGHCEQFLIAEVDKKAKTVIGKEFLTPPPHEPGILPAWLAKLHINYLIAGGIGQRAVQILAENNIQVIMGVGPQESEVLIEAFLNDSLQSGGNICDH